LVRPEFLVEIATIAHLSAKPKSKRKARRARPRVRRR
jgi:hypothetical protein